LLKVLKFGTKKLFQGGVDEEQKKDELTREYKVDEEALAKILDREAQFAELVKGVDEDEAAEG